MSPNIGTPSMWESTAVKLRGQRGAHLKESFPRERTGGRGSSGTAQPLSNHQAEFRAPVTGDSEVREAKSIALIEVPLH